VKKILFLLPIFLLSFAIFKSAFAKSSLEVATDPSFSSQTLNFSPGQTIYVRTLAGNDGRDKHLLNLRDNQYNFLQSYDLARTSDNQFSTSLTAPQVEGYYSLEVQIESGSNVATSVKTIKVGSPASANVKVNVKSEVKGQSVTVNDNADKNDAIQSPSAGPAAQDASNWRSVPDQELLENPDFTFGEPPSFFLQIEQFFAKIWESFWPF